MIWKPKKKTQKRTKYFYKYDPWFAWYPIELDDGRRVWLEWVECKREIVWFDTHTVFGVTTTDYYNVWKVRLLEK